MAKTKRKVKQSKGKSKRSLKRTRKMKRNRKNFVRGGLPVMKIAPVIAALFGLAKEHSVVPTKTNIEYGTEKQLELLKSIEPTQITKWINEEKDKSEYSSLPEELKSDDFSLDDYLKSVDMEEAAKKGDKLDKAVGS